VIAPEELKHVIESGIDGCSTVVVTDLTGTQDHYQALIVASGFEGKMPLARHRLVYKALGDLMAGPVHALTLETLTPAEHAAKGSLS
jgi:stress-induced morphogen